MGSSRPCLKHGWKWDPVLVIGMKLSGEKSDYFASLVKYDIYLTNPCNYLSVFSLLPGIHRRGQQLHLWCWQLHKTIVCARFYGGWEAFWWQYRSTRLDRSLWLLPNSPRIHWHGHQSEWNDSSILRQPSFSDNTSTKWRNRLYSRFCRMYVLS